MNKFLSDDQRVEFDEAERLIGVAIGRMEGLVSMEVATEAFLNAFVATAWGAGMHLDTAVQLFRERFATFLTMKERETK